MYNSQKLCNEVYCIVSITFGTWKYFECMTFNYTILNMYYFYFELSKELVPFSPKGPFPIM